MTPTTSYNYGFLNVCVTYNYSIHAVFSAAGRSATPPLQAQKLADLFLEIPVQGWAANQTANSEATKMLGHRLQIASFLNWVVETSRVGSGAILRLARKLRLGPAACSASGCPGSMPWSHPIWLPAHFQASPAWAWDSAKKLAERPCLHRCRHGGWRGRRHGWMCMCISRVYVYM